MNIIVKPSFDRDLDKVRSRELRLELDKRLTQIENAKSSSNVTGLKQLRNFKVHYRIKIESGKYSYRIGAVVRGNTIWLIRFQPRKKIYKLFP